MGTYRTNLFAPEEYRQRPRDLDFEVADFIIDRLSNGETLIDICSGDRDMPLPGTFIQWCEDDPTLEERYSLARRRGADVNFDAALEAAFDPDSTRGRVRSEALMRHVERTHPEKYSLRTTTKAVEPDKDKGGFDAGADIRRRIEAMAARNAAAVAVSKPSENT